MDIHGPTAYPRATHPVITTLQVFCIFFSGQAANTALATPIFAAKNKKKNKN
jgi:hypothetical protein